MTSKRECAKKFVHSALTVISYVVAMVIVAVALVWGVLFFAFRLGALPFSVPDFYPLETGPLTFTAVLSAVLLVIVALELAETLISDDIVHLADALAYALGRKSIVEGEIEPLSLIGVVAFLFMRVLIYKLKAGKQA